MPSSKGLGILMEDQLAWKITTVKHNALSLTNRSMVCHAIPLTSFQSLLQTPSSCDTGEKKSFKNLLIYSICPMEMGACISGRTRLKHGWKGYEDKGQTWDCQQTEKGLLDMQPLPPTLCLLQTDAFPKWTGLDLHYLTGLHMASSILLLLWSQNSARGCEQHIGACTTPKHTQTSWFNSKLEQSPAHCKRPMNSTPFCFSKPTHTRNIPKHAGFEMPTAHQVIKLVFT